jgi:hypothetical protein
MQASAAWTRWVRVGLATGMLGVQLDGCATGGYTPGLTEPDVADRSAAEDFALSRVRSGSQIRVTLHDGSIVTGKYRGVERMKDPAYLRRVEEFRRARPDSLAPLPAPGSKIIVHLGRSKARPARLEAYGLHSLELSWNGKGTPLQVPFDDFLSVTDSSGHEWYRRALWTEAGKGRLPSFAQIEMDTDQGREAFPVDQISNVYARTSSGEWVAAALIIVGLGAIVLIAIGAAPYYYYPSCTGSGYYTLRNELRSAP